MCGAMLDPTPGNGLACRINFLFFVYVTGHVYWHVQHISNVDLPKESFRRLELVSGVRISPAGIYADLTNEAMHLAEIYFNITLTVFM
jgi:hypothetical protein